ncbi:pirin family protein [Rhizobium sp. CFBP 8762]|uniref:pirin family protein n=1 Tax=Rhizobium sp. CFBP 8762 TaxID=2775279 RepID=UPI001786E775|nr:pirin family protein [Rhizobium sp. CFBP 8762]MBD8553848.1 pirin family protein [Rhizobium sp. CFBP 8762]
MTIERRIQSVRSASRQDIGNLYTRAVFSVSDELDPFLLLAHHGPQTFPPGSSMPEFGPHPHRGFETVTFLLAGDSIHQDSEGREVITHAGGVQWMTAGSGVVHSEKSPNDFWSRGGELEVLQLWVNLPSQLKMTAPRLENIQPNDIVAVPLPNNAGELNLISGRFGGKTGPADSLTGVFASTLSLTARALVSLPTPARRRVLFYVIKGRLTVADKSVNEGDLVRFEDEGEIIELTVDEDAFVLFAHGDVIGEPVVAQGPFVMNTEAEIKQAYADFRSGTFGRLSRGMTS